MFAIHISSGDPPPEIVTITGMTGGEVFPVDDPQALQAVFRRIDEMKATKLEKTASGAARPLRSVLHGGPLAARGDRAVASSA